MSNLRSLRCLVNALPVGGTDKLRVNVDANAATLAGAICAKCTVEHSPPINVEYFDSTFNVWLDAAVNFENVPDACWLRLVRAAVTPLTAPQPPPVVREVDEEGGQAANAPRTEPMPCEQQIPQQWLDALDLRLHLASLCLSSSPHSPSSRYIDPNPIPYLILNPYLNQRAAQHQAGLTERPRARIKSGHQPHPWLYTPTRPDSHRIAPDSKLRKVRHGGPLPLGTRAGAGGLSRCREREWPPSKSLRAAGSWNRSRCPSLRECAKGRAIGARA